MAAATWVVEDIEGNGKGSKGDGDSNEGGGQVRGQWQRRKKQW
jgi:hypothetical protein